MSKTDTTERRRLGVAFWLLYGGLYGGQALVFQLFELGYAKDPWHIFLVDPLRVR